MHKAETVPRIVPKIVIDARMVGPIPHGIARYTTLLANGLKTLSPLPYDLSFLVHSSTPQDLFAPFKTIVVKAPFLNPSELWEIPQKLKESGAHLYHSPSFSSLWNSPCPSLVTVHDLNHLQYGSFSQKLYYQVLLKRFMKSSARVMTVSEFSKTEILKWLPQLEVEVVYNAIDPLQLVAPSIPYEHPQIQPGQAFFCLSNLKPHKNLKTLVAAYQKYRSQTRTPWPLVLSVNDFSNTPGVISLGPLDSEKAASLLQQAGGIFFPSLYEGFGLPPVEGASQGKPIVASRIPPHEEGLADLLPHEVHWVAPLDIHGWCSAFHRVQKGELSPPSEKSRKSILDRFSVHRLASKMHQIYCSELEKNGHSMLGSSTERTL